MTGRRTRTLVPLAVAAAVLLPPVRPADALGSPAGERRCAAASTAVARAVPWAQQRLGPQRVWMLTRGRAVTVAVLDTGVSRSAPALAGRVLAGKDVLTGRRADNDCAGHGTFVGGLIAAGQLAGTGFAGVAPDARILPIRVTDQAGDVHPEVLATGISAAVDGGATVIAVVQAAPFGSPALAAAVAGAQRRGCLVIAPAATARNQTGDVAYPAALPGVLSVTAIGSDGRPPSEQPTARPTLAAPGGDLVSIGPAGKGNVAGSGLNLAVGFVAGAAALVWTYLPRLSPADVAARLAATTDPVGSAPDPTLGSGILDPVAAVTAVLPAAQEGAAPAPPAPLVLDARATPDPRPGQAALYWSGGVLGAGLVVGLVAASVVRGRRRGWSTEADAGLPATGPGAVPAATGPPAGLARSDRRQDPSAAPATSADAAPSA